MRAAHTALGTLLVALAATMSTGCFNEDPSGLTRRGPTTTGSLRVITTTTGADLDPDGYYVHLGGAPVSGRLGIGSNDTLVFTGLRAGIRSVVLGGVAANCEVVGGFSTVTVVARDTVDAVFAGTCAALGNVVVTVVTTGIDSDPNGYRVTAQSAGTASVAIGETVTFRLAAGDHVLTLTDVAANCDVTSPNPLTVPVVSGGTVALAFDVACAQATLLAYYSASERDIFAIASNGTARRRLTNHEAVDKDPAWSPDGIRIAFTSNRTSTPQIYVMNADGSSPLQLTTGSAANSQPAWSPDGSRIVFVGELEGNSELYVMNADGTNPVRLTNNPAIDTDPTWSPDGRRIAFTSKLGGNSDIYVMNADGTAATRLTAFIEDEFHPAWSPDGTRLAFARNCSNGQCYAHIVVMNADGSGMTALTDGDDPAWSPDGRKIAYTSLVCDYYYYDYECENAGIRFVRLDGTGSHEIVNQPASRPAWQR